MAPAPGVQTVPLLFMPQIHPSPWGFTCRGVATPAVVCDLRHSHNTHAPVDGHPVGLTMGCGHGLHLRGQTRGQACQVL